MAPKNSLDTEAEYPLQAVVLADSFTRTFRPMSLERPKVLLPLANSPMIEYTLEMLANAQVKEIIVVCCWHAAQVGDYLRQSRWGSSKNPIVRVVSYPKADSAGGALRELASTNSVQSDPFILISGDVVSNVRLGPVLEAHNGRADKNQVMTMVFRKTNPGNPLRNFDDELVVATNAETKQLLLYEIEEGEGDEDNEGEISLKIGDDKFFIEHCKLEVRHDLLDCHIDICSPQVLDLIYDEYYDDLRLDMVRKEVASRELDHHFYVHELTMPQDYAARVHCVRSYDQVSKDVIGRWLYPLTPDNNWSNSDGTCWFSRGFMYREAGVFLDRTAKLGRCTMLGAETTVAEGAIIENSVLGRRVNVQAKAKIQGSYIWNGAIIGTGATIDRALICNDAVIGDGCKIMRGAIVSFGVVVEPNKIVLPFTRLTKADPYIDERGSWGDGSEEQRPIITTNMKSSPNVSTEGNIQKNTIDARFHLGGDPNVDDSNNNNSYREYTMEEEECDSPNIPNMPKWASKALNEATGIWKASKSLVMGSMGCEELEIAKQNRSWAPSHSPRRHRSSISDGETGDSINPRKHDRNILRHPSAEGEDSLSSQIALLLSEFLSRDPEAHTSGYHTDLAMELKGLRASRFSCSFEEIVSVSFATLLQTVFINFKTISSTEMKEPLGTFVKLVAPLLTKFTQDITNKEVDIQVGLLLGTEVSCLIGPSLAPEVLMDLPSADYRLERALGSDDIDPILNEFKYLRPCFLMLLFGFVKYDVVELPALLRWKNERIKLGSESKLAEIYRFSEKAVNQIIQHLSEEEDSSNDEEE